MEQPTRHSFRTVIVLALLGAVAVVSNATKAVHIDDTAYLEIARAIRADPRRAMSAGLSWTKAREPIHAVNQPHLFFYFLAATMDLAGDSDVAFHLVESCFTVAALLFFHALARRFAPRDALLLTSLFVLGPAVLPGQNVMCDLPMLAFWLAFLWALLTPRRGFHLAYPLLAATAAAAACLIKYTSLILLPVLAFDLWWRGEWRRLWVLLIPTAVLGLWSLCNYLDYGGIHLLGRESNAKHPEALFGRLVVFFICLGAVTPFSVVLLPRLVRGRLGLALSALGLTAGLITLCWSWSVKQEVPAWWGALRSLFLANGVVVLGWALVAAGVRLLVAAGFSLRPPQAEARGYGQFPSAAHRNEDARPFAVLAILLLGTVAFNVLFAPFVAVRHVLPAVAVTLLLIGASMARAETEPTEIRIGKLGRGVAFVATVGLGILLAVSDWLLADAYRTVAPQLAAKLSRSDRTIWYVGHWGWQWYAERAGMRQYEPGESPLREGDYLLVPEMVPRQEIAEKDYQRRQKEGSVFLPSGPGTFLRTMTRDPQGGYYAIKLRALPWGPSTAPLDEIVLFRIGPQLDGNP